MKRLLYVMAKVPVAGKAKTRLCPPLSPEQASTLYGTFLADVLATCRQVNDLVDGVTPAIAFAPSPEAHTYFQALAPDFDLVEQQGSNLSQRLDRVLRQALMLGADQVIAINSDSPTLPAHLIARAFILLESRENDLILGPCDDGGYYLIGVKGDFFGVVRNVEMSTATVLADTLAAAASAGLRVALLPRWYDVDDHASLRRLQRELATLPRSVAPKTRRLIAELHGESIRK